MVSSGKCVDYPIVSLDLYSTCLHLDLLKSLLDPMLVNNTCSQSCKTDYIPLKNTQWHWCAMEKPETCNLHNSICVIKPELTHKVNATWTFHTLLLFINRVAIIFQEIVGSHIFRCFALPMKTVRPYFFYEMILVYAQTNLFLLYEYPLKKQTLRFCILSLAEHLHEMDQDCQMILIIYSLHKLASQYYF